MQEMHFLSGLPRSGSTVLAALLNQHPQLHATPTSELCDLLGALVQNWMANPCVAAQALREDALHPLMRSVVESRYKDVAKPIVLDKSRGWPTPAIMNTMEKVMGYRPKIVATVRHIPDCMASFVRLIKPADLKDFCHNSQVSQHLRSSYVTLMNGYKARSEDILFVEYEQLLAHPIETLRKVTEFLGLATFKDWDIDHIESSGVKELDEIAWNIPNLHHVGPTLRAQHEVDSKEVLGSLYERFCQDEFWHNRPNPRRNDLVDRQLTAFMAGDFVTAEAIGKDAPADDDRAAFNQGWYEMRRGHMQKAMKLIDRGRIEGIFGNPAPSNQPMWTGKEDIFGKVVLLNLEGGFGDQICNARFATDLASKGACVVVAGAPELAQIVMKIDGVNAFIDNRVAGAVYHDYWVPASSAVVPLGYEFRDIIGSAYIPRTQNSRKIGLRVGIRWAGLKDFAHENLRRLNPEDLFALDGFNGVQLVNLQRDDPTEAPNYVERVCLDTWEDTRKAISTLDLVISSCTSTAHLAAAMGVPTWIAIPKNSEYYLWAVPGEKSAWYDSVTLFRQETVGSYKEPMEQIRNRLAAMAADRFKGAA